MSAPIPHIGPFTHKRQRLDRIRDWGRKHMPWMTAALLLGSVLCLTIWQMYAAGIALLSIGLLVNLALLVSDRVWEPVEILGIRGLTMIDDWLEEREDWIDPVAGWIYDCGHLDTRHFMCLRRMVEGPRAAPLDAVTGQWVVLMRSRNKEMCSSPMELVGGRMVEALEKVRIEKLKESLDEYTAAAPQPSRPRPRL